MKRSLIFLFTDAVLEFWEGIQRLQNLFRKKKEPTLLASNIHWCTHSQWMDRLVAYKHLDLWTADK